MTVVAVSAIGSDAVASRAKTAKPKVVTGIREVTGSQGSVVSSNEVFGLDSTGTLRATGLLSDRSREILADVCYDSRELLGTVLR